jgi:Fe-S oxidoreductase
VLPQLKSCMLCGKCYIVCPRGINTRHLILSICKIYNI